MRKSIQIIVKVLRLLLLLLIVVGLAACGGGDEAPGDTSDIKKYDRAQTARKQAEQQDETYQYQEDYDTEEEKEPERKKGLISAADISPGILRVDSDITVKVKTAEPLEENQYLIYKTWKNKELLEETKDPPQFPAFTFKKHDVLFTEVTLYEENQLIAKKRTNMLQVLNSPPVIEQVTLPDVQGPGTYEFVVTAKDIDDDQITFSLEADDLQVDAQIDPDTGTVTCILDDNPPESIKFTIVADDGDRGVTKKIVFMRFFRRPKKQE
jgi:hypothetical protein